MLFSAGEYQVYAVLIGSKGDVSYQIGDRMSLNGALFLARLEHLQDRGLFKMVVTDSQNNVIACF